MPVAGIVGTGLIGASIGLALRSIGWSTLGWDPDLAALSTAAEGGAVDPRNDLEGAVRGPDLVVLAGPLSANVRTLAQLETEALVTDVTSVKRPLVGVASRTVRFVGGHPMAGREHAGPDAATSALFQGAAWVLCTDGANREDLESLAALVSEIGAHPVEMSAAAHDRAVAQTSHLPHLLAVALTNLVASDSLSSDLVAGSFRDLTRVAGADTGWWPEVLAANSDEVSRALSELTAHTQILGVGAAEDDLDTIAAEFDRARAHRLSMAQALQRVAVVLQDRPGELARVGHALEATGVDVRDLQLRHAEHGGGGMLTITVRPEDAAQLSAQLENEGFKIV